MDGWIWTWDQMLPPVRLPFNKGLISSILWFELEINLKSQLNYRYIHGENADSVSFLTKISLDNWQKLEDVCINILEFFKSWKFQNLKF